MKKLPEIMANARNHLVPVRVFKRFRFAGESWAVTDSLGPFDSHIATHVETGMCAGDGDSSIEGAILRLKAAIKEKGLAKLKKGVARAKRERKFLDRKDKIKAKALAKLTYWEKRSLDIEV